MKGIEKYISNLEKEFEKFSFDNMKYATDTQKFVYLYSYYHYFNADSSKLLDIIQGEITDPSAADRISGIYVDYDADQCDVDAVVAYYIPADEELNFPIALASLKDAESVLLKHFDGQYTRLKSLSVLNDDDYKVSQNKPLKIRLITNYTPKTGGKKNSILNAFKALKPEKDYISFSIQFGTDIEYEILEIEDPKEYVDCAVVQTDNNSNHVKYGEEKSLLVNLSAQSLHYLYEQYGYRGLFAQNLRYYVKNTKIDDSIITSIKETPELFWYFNNGVIIICDDYEVNGNEILLSNFSIINGGQTTKLIGETEIDKDFFLQCKIVKNKYKNENDKIAFIAKVAEASNTQKPIKEKDLIANRPEQRLLKRHLAEVGVYCQIKRGEKVNKKLYPEAWQNTTNEELGQFLLSFVYQKPGAARGNKASICGNKERYALLFSKEYNCRFLADILKIKAYYKLWMAHIKKTDDGVDSYKVGLVNNGMFFVTSIIGVLCKLFYHPNYRNIISQTVISDQQIEVVAQHDIDHPIFAEGMAKEDFFDLFELCYSNFYRQGYEFLKSFKGSFNNYSNFTKVDNNYKTYVFKQLCLLCMNGFPELISTKMTRFFAPVTEDDLERDKALLSKYINVVSSDIGEEPDLPEGMSDMIKEALIAYRTKTYKLNHIKPYEVFKNVSCDRISKYAPTDIERLKALRCLDEAQVELYGNDIIDIVNKCLNA